MKKLLIVAGLVCLSSSAFADGGLRISTYSIGTGVNFKAMSTAREIIAKALQEGKVAKYSENHWGLEGETEICVQFKYDQDSLVQKSLEQALKGKKRVSVTQLGESDKCE